MVGEPQPKAGVAFVAFDYDTPLKQISLLTGYAKLRSNIVHSRPIKYTPLTNSDTSQSSEKAKRSPILTLILFRTENSINFKSNNPALASSRVTFEWRSLRLSHVDFFLQAPSRNGRRERNFPVIPIFLNFRPISKGTKNLGMKFWKVLVPPPLVIFGIFGRVESALGVFENRFTWRINTNRVRPKILDGFRLLVIVTGPSGVQFRE